MTKNKNKNTKWDIVSIILCIPTVLFCIYGWIAKNANQNIAQIFNLVTLLTITIINNYKESDYYMYAKIGFLKSKSHLYYLPITLIIIALSELIIQYATIGKLHGPGHILTSMVFIPALVYISLRYLYKINKKYKLVGKAIRNTKKKWIDYIINLSTYYLFFHWFGYNRNNFSEYSLLVNMFYDLIAMVTIITIFIYIILILRYLKKTLCKKESHTCIKFKDIYPREIILFCVLTLIAWQSTVFIRKDYVLEVPFFLTGIILINIMVLFAAYIHCYLKIKAERSDIYIITAQAIVLIVYMIIVFCTVVFYGTNMPGDYAGQIISALILLLAPLLVLYIILQNNNETISNE